jgi:hypothetical protein
MSKFFPVIPIGYNGTQKKGQEGGWGHLKKQNAGVTNFLKQQFIFQNAALKSQGTK